MSCYEAKSYSSPDGSSLLSPLSHALGMCPLPFSPPSPPPIPLLPPIPLPLPSLYPFPPLFSRAGGAPFLLRGSRSAGGGEIGPRGEEDGGALARGERAFAHRLDGERGGRDVVALAFTCAPLLLFSQVGFEASEASVRCLLLRALPCGGGGGEGLTSHPSSRVGREMREGIAAGRRGGCVAREDIHAPEFGDLIERIRTYSTLDKQVDFHLPNNLDLVWL